MHLMHDRCNVMTLQPQSLHLTYLLPMLKPNPAEAYLFFGGSGMPKKPESGPVNILRSTHLYLLALKLLIG
jgi:hypothetical protein